MSQPNPLFLLSAGVAQAVEHIPPVSSLRKQTTLVLASPILRIFLYVAQAVECVLGVALIK